MIPSRIGVGARAIATSAATSLRSKSSAQALRLTAGPMGGLPGAPGAVAGRVDRFYSASPQLKLGSLRHVPDVLRNVKLKRLESTEEIWKIYSAASRSGIISPPSPPMPSTSITAEASHRAASDIHVTTNPENAREVVSTIFNKSNLKSPSSSVFESVMRREPINPQTIKAQCRAANIATKKETDELHTILDSSAKIRALDIDKQSEATDLISSHLYDASKGSIGRFNTGNLLPVVLGLLYKAGEYDLVVRLMHDIDNSSISNDLPSMGKYVRALLESQYTNIHLVNAALDHMEENFGSVPEVLSLKAKFNRIQADIAKQALDIHHYDAIKYKSEDSKTKKLLKGAEIEHTIVFPDIPLENKTALESMRNFHENLATQNYLDAYALGNNPKHGEEAIHVMRGIVFREKSLLEMKATDTPEKLTKHIELLENKINEIQNSLDQLLAARSPHAHKKTTVALSILEKGLRDSPNDEKRFLLDSRNLIKACKSSHDITKTVTSLSAHKELFKSPSAQEKIQTLIDILSIKFKSGKPEKEITDQCILQLFNSNPLAKAEILTEEAAISPSQQLMKRSIFYAHQTGSHIPENFSRGGLVSTQQIGTADFKVFGELITTYPINQLLPTSTDTRTLAEVKDPDEAIKIMQKIVRFRFNNSAGELEIEVSPEHKLMESRIRKEQELSGFTDKTQQKEAFDSHTSNIITYAKGLGDCRIHAQSMQMYFTTWKALQLDEVREKISSLEGKAKIAGITPKIKLELEELKKRETELNSVHLGTIQSDIYLPIQRVPDPTHAGWTQPKQDEHGRFLLDVQRVPDPAHPGGPPIVTVAPPKKKEEHVLTALFRTDPGTGEVKISLADAFYQGLFPLGSGALVPLGTTTADGFNAGSVEGVNPITGDVVKIPVTLHLSDFAGDRSTKSTAGEGQILLHGHEVNASAHEIAKACTSPAFAADYQLALDQCT